MEFTYLFKALLRRKWIIVICVAVALAAGFVFTMNTKPIYKSIAQLATGFTQNDVIKLSDENFSLPQIDVKFNNTIEDITSLKVLSLVSYQLLLHDLQSQTPFTQLTEKVKATEAYKNVDQQTVIKIVTNKRDSLLMLSNSIPTERAIIGFMELYNYSPWNLNASLKVNRSAKTDFIDIVYFSHNPYLSAFVVNTLCNEFKRFYGLDRGERASLSIISLDSLVKARRDSLEATVQKKNAFMSAQNVLDVTMEGSSKLGQISSFEGQLIEAKALQSNLQYRVQQLNDLIKNAKARGLSSVVSPVNTSSDYSSANNDYIRLRKQYNDIYKEYKQKGSNNPELKKQLDDISQKMSGLSFRDDASGGHTGGEEGGMISIDELIQRRIDAEAQLRATNLKIAAIQSKLGQLNGGLNGMAEKGASIQQLQKEIELAQAEFNEAKDKLNVAMNINEKSAGTFKQTLIGEPATRPLPSKRMMIVALAGLCGFFASSLSIIGIEFLDQSIKTPSQFQRQTGLPLLATVNMVKLQNNDILEKVTVTNNDEKRENIFREHLRKLRYEVLSSSKRIFLFTSTEPHQGKTMLIQSLAYSLSLAKKKVLIIDTNFCNNDLTKAIKATPVLEKFSVNGKPFAKSDVYSLITKTSAEGVDMIGCQGGNYTPSEILPKNHLLNYLDALKEEYDFIFMEGAPLNDFTDTKELIYYTEGLIAVFSAEAVLSASDRESIAFLKEHENKFLGAVLNKVKEDNLDI